MIYYPRLTCITSSLSRSYVIPALFLNPILFLHSVNAILSRVLAPIVVHNVTVQPPAYTPRGPSAEHPHLDLHASDQLCWSYTLVMVGVQLMAFSRVQMRRAKWKEMIKSEKEADKLKRLKDIGWGMEDLRAVDEFQQTLSDRTSPTANGLEISSPHRYKGKAPDSQSNSDESEESQESEVIL